MSCVPPQIYATRFMGFMREIFLEESSTTHAMSRSEEVEDSENLMKGKHKT